MSGFAANRFVRIELNLLPKVPRKEMDNNAQTRRSKRDFCCKQHSMSGFAAIISFDSDIYLPAKVSSEDGKQEI